MTGQEGRPSRTDTLLLARRLIQAAGQTPRTEDLSGNPGEAAWALLAQVLDVIDAAELEQLAAERPGWSIWRQYAARKHGASPPLVVRAVTVEQLRERIDAEDGSYGSR